MLLQPVALGGANRVEVPGRACALALPRQGQAGHLFEGPGVLRGAGATLLGPALQVPQLDSQDGRLERVEAAVGPEHDVVVSVRGGSVVGDLPHARHEVGVRGRDHSCVAAGPEVLGRIEAEAGGVAQRPGPSAVPFRAVGLGRVLEDREPVPAGDLVDGGHVRRVAIEMDGDDELRAGRDRRLEPLRVHGVSPGIDVDEDRRGPHEEDCLAGSDEGVGDGHDLVPGSDPVGSEGDVERVRAVGHRTGVRRAAELGELVLELPHVRSKDVGGALENSRDGFVDLGADALQLSLEIDDGDVARLGHVRPAPFNVPPC